MADTKKQLHLRQNKEISHELQLRQLETLLLRTKLSSGEKFLPLLREYLAEFQKHHAIEVNLGMKIN